MIKKYILKNWFPAVLILIIGLSLFLRFINYGNRFGLASDQAISALVSRYALAAKKFPLLGPFSSAGPFQTGGEWYWFVALGTLFYPSSVLSPWVFLTLTYVLFVLLIMIFSFYLIAGKDAGRATFGTFFNSSLTNQKINEAKFFAIIVGILTAVSPAQISQGLNLTNQSPIALISLFVLWSGVKYLSEKKPIWLFLLGFFPSLAASIHLEGVGLFVVVPIVLILAGSKFRNLWYLLLGIILPFSPILISDLTHNFFNFKNMLFYFMHDQYKISLDVLGRRWLTYLAIFWPKAWSNVIGGQNYLGGILFFGSLLFIFLNFIKRKLSLEWIFISLSFLGMLTVVRYTRTPLFDSYIVFLHPFILLLSGYFIYSIFNENKYLSLILVFFLVFFSLKQDYQDIKNATNTTVQRAKSLEQSLLSSYPNEKFAVYNYGPKSMESSLSLSLYLDAEGKIADKGRKVGYGFAPFDLQDKYTIIWKDDPGHVLLDLDNEKDNVVADEGWYFLNPSSLYHSIENWFK